jgi:hypothetical protein
MILKTCEVGLFRLPGILIEADEEEVIPEEKLTEIDEWSKSEQGTGKRMTDKLWSFKTEAQRDWFILRWSDQ